MPRAFAALLLSILAAAQAQAALPTIPLYGAAKAEMYKYAFPSGAASAEPQEGKDGRQMVFTLKADASSGGGIGVDKLRLNDYVAAGALEFFVRGSNLGDGLQVGFVQAQGMDAKELAFQNLVSLAAYARPGAGWTKVTIPLKDFPKEGSRWVEAERKRVSGPFNWSRVSEFVVAREAAGSGPVQVAFTNISIVPSYDAAKLQAAKPKPGQASGPISYYSEAFAAEAGGAYAYPTGKATVEEASGAKAGSRCLKVSLDNASWSGAAVYRSPLDLRSYQAQGVIELWIKGGQGGEKINLGLLEKTNGSHASVSLAGYLPSGLTKAWQKVQVPLKDIPAQGMKWDAEKNQNVNYAFDWSKVGEVVLNNGGAGQASGVIYLDEVVIKPGK